MPSARRLLVVGASSGIGRAVVQAAVAEGRRVAAVSRRRCDVPGVAMAEQYDVRLPGDCAALVTAAIDTLGGLDAVVYAAGVAPLAPVGETTPETWAGLLATNVVGGALVVNAAVASLAASSGSVVFLGSDSVPRPWPGLVPYAASKAALQTLAAGWAVECPDVRFHCLAVEPTITSFADAWDPATMQRYLTQWSDEGYWPQAPGAAADVARRVLALV